MSTGSEMFLGGRPLFLGAGVEAASGGVIILADQSVECSIIIARLLHNQGWSSMRKIVGVVKWQDGSALVVVD